jgi:EmrB/QacA subfamily drug resistance transporter
MIVALVVACAFFMETFTGTVITTALPAMAVSFGSDAVELSIGVTAYMLALAVFIPASGWAADRYGARTVFRTAIGVFTLASVGCGLSNSLFELVAMRVVQGIGGAMMVPVGRLVVLRSVDKSEYPRAMAYITVPAFIGPVLGPPIGGFITTFFSWRWVFFLNIPIGLVGIVLASILIENVRDPNSPPLDWRGFLLSGVSLASVLYGLDLAAHGTLRDGIAFIALLAFGLALGAAAFFHSHRHPHPLIGVSLFRIPTFAIATLGGTFFRTGAGSIPYLLPVLLQLGLGMTAFAAGLLVFADAFGNMAMNGFSPAVLRRWGFRKVLLWNGAINTAGMAASIFFTATTPAVVIALVLFVAALSRSMQYNALSNLQYADVETRRMSAASSFASMLQQLCSGAGIATGAIILQLALIFRGASPDELAAGDIRYALLAVALITFGGLAFYRHLDARAGAEVSGHAARVTAASDD